MLLFVMLTTTLVYNARSQATNTYFQQSYESKNLGLLIDVLYASPQQATIRYKVSPSFHYAIGKGKVTVTEKTPVAFTFAEDKNQQLDLSRDEEYMVVAKK